MENDDDLVLTYACGKCKSDTVNLALRLRTKSYLIRCKGCGFVLQTNDLNRWLLEQAVKGGERVN